jgi:Zinc carboxypeptidase
MNYEKIYISNKQQKLFGRYITLNDIEPLLVELNENSELKTIGFSVNNCPIYSYTIGKGKIKVLIWSQMHGNESTTTKAIFDYLNFLKSNSELSQVFLSAFTFCIIPMLNPDGSQLYTRENYNKIDLNRDFKDLSQPESMLLQAVFEDFKPHYCYNMHDQRTIFGVGSTGQPATVSFLAPSYNENRDFNENRTKAAVIIGEINEVLQEYIPNQVGRFDDGFNINCVGDSFQSQGATTILFEAGHYQGDYDREMTRKFIFIGLVSSFCFIKNNLIKSLNTDKYLGIPQNNIVFYDFIYKNVQVIENNKKQIINFASQYIEELKGNAIVFNAKISQIGNLDNFYGHIEIDCENQLFEDEICNFPTLNAKSNFKISRFNIINGKNTK